MHWRATLTALITGGLLAACLDPPNLRLDETILSDVAVRAAQDTTTQLRAQPTPSVTWSDLLPGDDGSEDDVELEDAPQTQPPVADASDDGASLRALMQGWTYTLEAAAFEGDEESEPSVLQAEADEGTADAEDAGTPTDVAQDAALSDEMFDELVAIDEELVLMQERVLDLEAQVQQQRTDLDTVTLAMTLQARRVTILEATVSQLALVCGR